jgi:hypothetical protein
MTRRARARRPSEMPIQIGVMLRVYLWDGAGIGIIDVVGVGTGVGEVIVSFIGKRAL